MLKTKVVLYNNRRAMNGGIKTMQRDGWTVLNVQSVPQGWSCLKTALLFWILWPLALLGRKPEKLQVTFQKDFPDKK